MILKKIRLDKYLADHTEWTRSQIKKKVASGLVKVQDAVIKDAGYKVSAEDVIEMEGQRICGQQYQYLLFHKPAGIVSATEDTREETVLDAVRRGGFAGEGEVPFLAKDLFPMGRLDKDTEGLLILTNDGELAHRLLSPKFHVEKTYLVQLMISEYKDMIETIQQADPYSDIVLCAVSRCHKSRKSKASGHAADSYF